MPDTHGAVSRRSFVTRAAVGTVAAASVRSQPLLGADVPAVRNALVLSDIHVGLEADGVDGGEWFSRAIGELERNQVSIDYAAVLGDISHGATEQALETYVEIRDSSGIPTWFELAGNHEWHGGNTRHYESRVRSLRPHAHVDGNVAWFFLSDEDAGVRGFVSDESIEWLSNELETHKNDVVIVCTHQLVHGTVRASAKDDRCIHPKEKIAQLLSDHRIDLWMFGHEHHRPYSKDDVLRRGRTTFLNVASLSHAYNTRESQSYVLQFEERAKQIVARRRVHDVQAFANEYELIIPLESEIRLGPGTGPIG